LNSSLAHLLPSYGWPKFALKGQIMPFLKSFELGYAFSKKFQIYSERKKPKSQKSHNFATMKVVI